MTTPHDQSAHDHKPGQHGGHGWMMMACCIPMLAIAIALVATGVVSPGFLIITVGCIVMMWLMMRGMGGMGGGEDSEDQLRDRPDMLHKHGDGR
jgi:hypothetical protein